MSAGSGFVKARIGLELKLFQINRQYPLLAINPELILFTKS